VSMRPFTESPYLVPHETRTRKRQTGENAIRNNPNALRLHSTSSSRPPKLRLNCPYVSMSAKVAMFAHPTNGEGIHSIAYLTARIVGQVLKHIANNLIRRARQGDRNAKNECPPSGTINSSQASLNAFTRFPGHLLQRNSPAVTLEQHPRGSPSEDRRTEHCKQRS
jgi:hypothetical protein